MNDPSREFNWDDIVTGDAGYKCQLQSVEFNDFSDQIPVEAMSNMTVAQLKETEPNEKSLSAEK